ncbi:MAG: HEPN domain-containing protein [Nanoarchaeota archaeon]
MKAKDMLIKSMKRPDKERGLRIAKSNDYLADGHLKKADHNLIVMTDLSKLGHEDWVIITAYYAMYHSALALLSRIGLESKDHATTVAVLEYFFGEHISNDMIKKFNELKEKKDKLEAITIDERYIDYLWKAKQAREAVQYGISINYKETNLVVNNARTFVAKMKLVNSELDDKILSVIQKQVIGLKEIAMKCDS